MNIVPKTIVRVPTIARLIILELLIGNVDRFALDGGEPYLFKVQE